MKALPIAMVLAPIACSPALADVHSIDQTARFSLKPRVRLTLLPPAPRSALRAQFGQTDTPPARDEGAILFSVMRQTLQVAQRHESASRTGAPLAGHLSRTRVRTIRVEGTMPIDDRGSVQLGWSGAKYSNRNANVTAAYSNANLRAKDWFQPHAALNWSAGQAVTLRAAYDEAVLAYADIGMSGPLGMAREDFRQFQTQLRPERHRRMALMAQWAATDGLRLAIDLYGGRLDDRLVFGDGSALPVNRGTADLQGGALSLAHRLAPGLDWTLRYSHARVNRLDGDTARERELAAEGRWQAGPWQAVIRAAQTSRPALLLPGDMDGRTLRLSAAIHCQPPEMPGLTLGLRLADPDRLASSAFVANDRMRGLRAQDQARSLLVSANLAW